MKGLWIYFHDENLLPIKFLENFKINQYENKIILNFHRSIVHRGLLGLICMDHLNLWFSGGARKRLQRRFLNLKMDKICCFHWASIFNTLQ